MKRLLISLVVVSAGLSASAQNGPTDVVKSLLSRLPAALELNEPGPQQYVFTCDYFQLDISGDLKSKQRVSATYTRGLPGGTVRWNDVRIAKAATLVDGFPKKGEPQAYMEGFSYKESQLKDVLKPAFFAGFPDEITTKTLVWDTVMFEMFAWNYFDKLKLNEPYRLPSDDLRLPGGGAFRNKQVELTWMGVSKRNCKICALFGYQALFNKLEVERGSLRLKGRSHYWGDIWVSLTDKQIEHATLNEDVVLGFDLPNRPGKQIVNPVRQGTFERKKS
jgi:hypothetical protein